VKGVATLYVLSRIARRGPLQYLSGSSVMASNDVIARRSRYVWGLARCCHSNVVSQRPLRQRKQPLVVIWAPIRFRCKAGTCK
jgi:hypothetical protein